MTPPVDLAPASLTAAYEQLRTWATGQAAPGPRPAGLAVFLRRGLAGWIALAPSWLPAAAAPTPSGGAVATPTAAVGVDQVAGVLAMMIAAQQQEGSR
jgi:hypothetical protein